MWPAAELGVALALLAPLAGAGVQAEGGEGPRPPSVVLVVADDLGWGDLGCYGGTRIRTPNLDRMAAEGLRFTDFYAGGTVCVPSRCCLLTGKHSGHSAVRLNGPFPLPEAETTIGEALRPLGYRAACIGKWALGRNQRRGGNPLEHGFDEFYGFIDQTEAHRQYPPFLYRDGRRELDEENPVARTHYAHDRFTAEALAFLERSRERPFLLYLPYTLPHADLDVPDDSLEAYRGAFPERPYVERPARESERLFRDQATPRAAYAAMVSRIDRDVGRLLEALRTLGIEESTLVLFTSDNGPADAGGADPEFFRSAGPFRAGKRLLYEGGLRVPLIARWPGHVPAGAVSDFPCASWDLLATFVALAGGVPPEGTDGLDLSPTLLGRPADQAPHELLYWESVDHEFGPLQAVRSGAWKLLRSGLAEDEPTVELYDLASDPGETRDLAASEPGRVAELTRRLEEAHVAHAQFPLLPSEQARPRQRGRRDR